MEAESLVLKRAIAKGGVVDRDEAIALGMSPRTLERRVADGWFLPVGNGILALPAIANSEDTLLRAATTALDATVSHHSAGRLHGLHGLGEKPVTVSVPIRRSNRFLDVTVHQLTDLAPEETTWIRDIPVTNPARTIVDLAAVLKQRQLADILDQSVRVGLTTYDEVADKLESLARKGKRGVVILRKTLELRIDGADRTESDLETRMSRLILEYNLPLPDLQYRPRWLRKVSGRVDFAYPADQAVIEGDSRRWHDTPEAFQLDRYRDNLAQLAGWRIFRFTWDDITKRPDYVASTMRQALVHSV